MTRPWRLFVLTLAISSVLMAVSCGTSGPVSVDGVKPVLGDSLPGAQGKTREDQIKIDRTVARACATGLFDRAKCDEHTTASAGRFAELRGEH